MSEIFFGAVGWSDCRSRAWVAGVAGLCCMCFWCTFRTVFFSLKEKWMILTKLNEVDKVWCQRFFFGPLVGRIVAAVHGLREWRVFAAWVFWCTFRTVCFSLKEKWVSLKKLNEEVKVWCWIFFWVCWLFGLSQPCMGCGNGGSLLHVFLVHVSHSLFYVERKMSDFDKAQ